MSKSNYFGTLCICHEVQSCPLSSELRVFISLHCIISFLCSSRESSMVYSVCLVMLLRSTFLQSSSIWNVMSALWITVLEAYNPVQATHQLMVYQLEKQTFIPLHASLASLTKLIFSWILIQKHCGSQQASVYSLGMEGSVHFGSISVSFLQS